MQISCQHETYIKVNDVLDNNISVEKSFCYGFRQP